MALGDGRSTQRVVFSGDLGAPYTPLLPAPRPPLAADIVVMESTYGDRVHESRKHRRERQQALCEHAFGNGGTLLVPAFSIGRTQELLYELEEIIHRHRERQAAAGLAWKDQRIDIRARIHTLGGYSAHADQADLLRFIGRMKTLPREVRLVHGDDTAKLSLAQRLRERHPGLEVVVP